MAYYKRKQSKWKRDKTKLIKLPDHYILREYGEKRLKANNKIKKMRMIRRKRKWAKVKRES